MRSDIQKRLERLEMEARAKGATAVDFGACLSEEEWRLALSAIDPDPHVAFASLTSGRLNVFVVVVGAGSGCGSFRELVASSDPGMHFWAARMAAWAIQTEGGTIHPYDTTPEGYTAALALLFPAGNSTRAMTSLRSALEATAEPVSAPHCISIMACPPRAIAMEMTMDDARL